MTHTKKKLRGMSETRLIATITFLLAWLRATHPEIYRKAEVRGALRAAIPAKGRGKVKKRGGGKRPGKAKSKKMSPKLKRFLKKHHRFPKKGELR
jgi:hypothetical protein